MRIATKIFFFFLLLAVPAVVKAQYYDSGQDVWSLNWCKIETKYFEIIFPDYYEVQAKRIASQIDSVPDAVGFSLPGHKRKIPLILHTQSVASNGLVVWAPKRMEWWTVSPQSSESQLWFEQLGIHEYRHVVQMQNITEGVSGILADIFGEHITGAIVALFVPKWFLEGDATATETALSNSGRGRSANFMMQTRAQIEEKGIPSYDKAAFGSYKDFVPDIYHLGYHLTAYGRAKYGTDIWQKSLHNVAHRPFQLNPFEQSVKKTTSKNMNTFYNETFHFFDSVWKANLSTKPPREPQKLPLPATKIHTQYLSPHFLNDTCVLVLKNSFESSQRFVCVDTNGNETLIRKTGSIYDNYFDLRQNKLLWCEVQRHPRWNHTIYSNLVEYDLTTGKRRTLSKGTRYFSPSFSPKGDKIVVAADDSLNCNKLLILSALTGEIQNTFHLNCLNSISFPVFSDDESAIYYMGLTPEGKAFCRLHITTGISETLTKPSYANFTYLKQKGDYLYFVADYAGTSQVYALHLQTYSIHKLTHARYGAAAFDFSADMQEILYSSYTSDGYRLEKDEVAYDDNLSQTPKNTPYPLAEVLSRQETKKINFSRIDTSHYEVEKYHKWAHLLNFHSWAPVSIDPAEQSIGTGVSIMSQNIFSTSFLDAGFLWNDQEEKGNLYANYSYRGFFPVLSTSLNYMGRQTKRTEGNILWNELIWSGQIRVPFNWNREAYLYGTSSSFYYEYKKMYPLHNYIYSITENQTVRLLVNAYWEQRKAYKMIEPRWGQTATVSLSKSFNSGLDAWLFSAYGRLFVPALMPTHSLNFYTGYQFNQQGAIVFSNQVQLARGYTNILPETFYSNKINYTLPLVYPDFAVWKLIYLKRIYTTLFYDFMWYTVPQVNNRYDYSIGNELYFDLNAFRLDFGFNLGLRTSYRPKYDDFIFDILFSLVL